MTSRRSRERLLKARGSIAHRGPSAANLRSGSGSRYLIGLAGVGAAIGVAALLGRRRAPPASEANAPEGGRLEKADVAIAAEAGTARHNPTVRALGAASEIADQVPSFVVCGAILTVGLATRQPRLAEAGAGMLASVLVAAALKSVVKALVSRTRPHAVLDGDAYAFEIDGRNGPHNHSFPSGHTSGAVAAARSLVRVYPAAYGPAYAAAAVIALVQIPRAKHYPADVAAGVAVGLVAVVAAAMPLVRDMVTTSTR